MTKHFIKKLRILPFNNTFLPSGNTVLNDISSKRKGVYGRNIEYIVNSLDEGYKRVEQSVVRLRADQYTIYNGRTEWIISQF